MDTIGRWIIASTGALVVSGCVVRHNSTSSGHSSTCVPTTLVDNGDPAFGYGTTVLSDLNEHNQVGDAFTLTTPTHIQAVEFWGIGADADFNIRIFEVTDGVPGELPVYEGELGVVPGTSVNYGGIGFLDYAAMLPEFTLPAGDYLLSVVDHNPAEDWYWAASCEDGCEGDSFRRADDDDPWDVGNWAFAFRLNGCQETSVCHCPQGQGEQCRTLSVGVEAVVEHLEHHPDDTPGVCESKT